MDPLPVYGSIYTDFGFERPYLDNRWCDRLENSTDVIDPSRSFEPCRPLRIRNNSKFSRPGLEPNRDRGVVPDVRLFDSTLLDETNRQTPHTTRLSRKWTHFRFMGPYIRNSALNARISATAGTIDSKIAPP
ncbi:hypothetical protein AVEN_250096-1 [Araneus ventricosus]|uniref:Uncharacterized protein n=1 Tax=Araneus ventricosus TaxID=182803 RepID=A0A4Y2VFK9_ARAVE|nr:hypothetical protein AVEN_250096-1 [Araneus ventricosus]